MKNLKKDNKGFSLVELIVVVLIMAIIAVALAPQVIKWVNNSRISADKNTLDSVKSTMQTVFTDENIYKDCKDKVIKVKISDSAAGTIDETAVSTWTGKKVSEKFEEYAGGKIADFKFKQSGYSVELEYTSGKLTKETPVGGETDISDK